MIFKCEHEIDTGPYLEKHEKFLMKNKGKFEDKLVSDISRIDNRATNYNGIDIQKISYLGNREFQLDYLFDWYVYNGCADMDIDGVEDESITLQISDTGEVVFDFPDFSQYSEPREYDC